MSIKNVEKFFDLIKSDENIAKELIKINNKIQQKDSVFDEEQFIKSKVVPIAKEHGINFTAKEFLEYAKNQISELSDEELLNISGGASRQSVAWGFLLATLGSFLNVAAINSYPLVTPIVMESDQEEKNNSHKKSASKLQENNADSKEETSNKKHNKQKNIRKSTTNTNRLGKEKSKNTSKETDLANTFALQNRGSANFVEDEIRNEKEDKTANATNESIGQNLDVQPTNLDEEQQMQPEEQPNQDGEPTNRDEQQPDQPEEQLSQGNNANSQDQDEDTKTQDQDGDPNPQNQDEATNPSSQEDNDVSSLPPSEQPNQDGDPTNQDDGVNPGSQENNDVPSLQASEQPNQDERPQNQPEKQPDQPEEQLNQGDDANSQNQDEGTKNQDQDGDPNPQNQGEAANPSSQEDNDVSSLPPSEQPNQDGDPTNQDEQIIDNYNNSSPRWRNILKYGALAAGTLVAAGYYVYTGELPLFVKSGIALLSTSLGIGGSPNNFDINKSNQNINFANTTNAHSALSPIYYSHLNQLPQDDFGYTNPPSIQQQGNTTITSSWRVAAENLPSYNRVTPLPQDLIFTPGEWHNPSQDDLDSSKLENLDSIVTEGGSSWSGEHFIRQVPVDVNEIQLQENASQIQTPVVVADSAATQFVGQQGSNIPTSVDVNKTPLNYEGSGSNALVDEGQAVVNNPLRPDLADTVDQRTVGILKKVEDRNSEEPSLKPTSYAISNSSGVNIPGDKVITTTPKGSNIPRGTRPVINIESSNVPDAAEMQLQNGTNIEIAPNTFNFPDNVSGTIQAGAPQTNTSNTSSTEVKFSNSETNSAGFGKDNADITTFSPVEDKSTNKEASSWSPLAIAGTIAGGVASLAAGFYNWLRPANEKILVEGFCGDTSVNNGQNVKWVLYKDGNLEISGAGDMANYWEEAPAPWYDEYKDRIKTVNIKEGVTSIGDFAFNSCTSLTSIKLAKGLETIGVQAFACCSSLKELVIPSSVKYIGFMTFSYCSSLESITYHGLKNPAKAFLFSSMGNSKSAEIPSIYVPNEYKSKRFGEISFELSDHTFLKFRCPANPQSGFKSPLMNRLKEGAQNNSQERETPNGTFGTPKANKNNGEPPLTPLVRNNGQNQQGETHQNSQDSTADIKPASNFNEKQQPAVNQEKQQSAQIPNNNDQQLNALEKKIQQDTIDAQKRAAKKQRHKQNQKQKGTGSGRNRQRNKTDRLTSSNEEPQNTSITSDENQVENSQNKMQVTPQTPAELQQNNTELPVETPAKLHPGNIELAAENNAQTGDSEYDFSDDQGLQTTTNFSDDNGVLADNKDENDNLNEDNQNENQQQNVNQENQQQPETPATEDDNGVLADDEDEGEDDNLNKDNQNENQQQNETEQQNNQNVTEEETQNGSNNVEQSKDDGTNEEGQNETNSGKEPQSENKEFDINSNEEYEEDAEDTEDAKDAKDAEGGQNFKILSLNDMYDYSGKLNAAMEAHKDNQLFKNLKNKLTTGAHTDDEILENNRNNKNNKQIKRSTSLNNLSYYKSQTNKQKNTDLADDEDEGENDNLNEDNQNEINKNNNQVPENHSQISSFSEVELPDMGSGPFVRLESETSSDISDQIRITREVAEKFLSGVQPQENTEQTAENNAQTGDSEYDFSDDQGLQTTTNFSDDNGVLADNKDENDNLNEDNQNENQQQNVNQENQQQPETPATEDDNGVLADDEDEGEDDNLNKDNQNEINKNNNQVPENHSQISSFSEVELPDMGSGPFVRLESETSSDISDQIRITREVAEKFLSGVQPQENTEQTAENNAQPAEDETQNKAEPQTVNQQQPQAPAELQTVTPENQQQDQVPAEQPTQTPAETQPETEHPAVTQEKQQQNETKQQPVNQENQQHAQPTTFLTPHRQLTNVQHVTPLLDRTNNAQQQNAQMPQPENEHPPDQANNLTNIPDNQQTRPPAPNTNLPQIQIPPNTNLNQIPDPRKMATVITPTKNNPGLWGSIKNFFSPGKNNNETPNQGTPQNNQTPNQGTPQNNNNLHLFPWGNPDGDDETNEEFGSPTTPKEENPASKKSESNSPYNKRGETYSGFDAFD